MIRRLALAALVPALLLASVPASAMSFDLPYLTFPPVKAGSSTTTSTSGR